jgi:DNA-binding NtrC family response regulator
MPNILIVDSDTQLRIDLQQQMLEAGFSVYIAPTPEKARILLQDVHIDLVLCDFFFPRARGLGFLQELIEFRPRLQIVALVGANDTGTVDYVRRIRNLGLNLVFTKPVNSVRLGASIKDLFKCSTKS